MIQSARKLPAPVDGIRRIPISQIAIAAPQIGALLDERATPMRSRVRQLVGECGPPREELIAMATMIRAEDGGSLRTFSGGLAHENGWFVSAKARRLLHWEGIAQRALIVRTESDFRFARVGTESVGLLFSDGAKHHRYTGDVELIGPDGSIIVVEVKRDERDLEDPQLRWKYAAVAEILRRCGIGFEIIFRDEIFVDRRHRANAELFASRAFVHVDRRYIDRFEAHAARNGCASTYGALSEVLEPTSVAQGRAILQALAVRRRVEIDITRRLTNRTPLTVH